MNKFIHNTARAGLAGALALGLSSTAFAGSFFGPIPANIRAANSGYELSAGKLSQNNVKFKNGVAAGSLSSSLPAYTMDFHDQGTHFGFGLHVNYASGSGTYTATNQTSASVLNNKMLDVGASLKLGFSPVSNLAIIPEVFVGRYVWNVAPQNTNSGHTFNYYNAYSGVGASVDYQLGEFVLSSDYKTGTVSNATMTVNIPGTGTFNLGNHSWKSYGARITWVPSSWISVFIAYNKTKFGYGKSAVGPSGYYAEGTTNDQGVTSLGVVIF